MNVVINVELEWTGRPDWGAKPTRTSPWLCLKGRPWCSLSSLGNPNLCASLVQPASLRKFFDLLLRPVLGNLQLKVTLKFASRPAEAAWTTSGHWSWHEILHRMWFLSVTDQFHEFSCLCCPDFHCVSFSIWPIQPSSHPGAFWLDFFSLPLLLWFLSSPTPNPLFFNSELISYFWFFAVVAEFSKVFWCHPLSLVNCQSFVQVFLLSVSWLVLAACLMNLPVHPSPFSLLDWCSFGASVSSWNFVFLSCVGGVSGEKTNAFFKTSFFLPLPLLLCFFPVSLFLLSLLAFDFCLLPSLPWLSNLYSSWPNLGPNKKQHGFQTSFCLDALLWGVTKTVSRGNWGTAVLGQNVCAVFGTWPVTVSQGFVFKPDSQIGGRFPTEFIAADVNVAGGTWWFKTCGQNAQVLLFGV